MRAVDKISFPFPVNKIREKHEMWSPGRQSPKPFLNHSDGPISRAWIMKSREIHSGIVRQSVRGAAHENDTGRKYGVPRRQGVSKWRFPLHSPLKSDELSAQRPSGSLLRTRSTDF